jgi:quercetin dioxygenase-like cupin family protein
MTVLLTAAAVTVAQTPAPLKRARIATHAVPAVTVDHVPVARLDFQAGQRTGRHTHPMPVVGYVLEGTFVVKVAGRPERRSRPC